MRIPTYIAASKLRKTDDDNRVGAFVANGVTRVTKKKQKRVLQSKGGGAPKPPSPMEEARAQMELERSRAQMAAEKEARDKAAAAAERQMQIEKARGAQSAAYDRAINYDDQQIAGRGLLQELVDRYNVSGLYGSEIDRQRAALSETDVNPNFTTKTAFEDALATAQGAYRTGTRNEFTKNYGDNYSYDQFADTADDAILEAILGSRRADALATIDAAKARGQLNDVGYARAQTKLDEQAKSGMSDLQKLGLGVLSGYRTDLDKLRQSELDKIGGLDLTQLYNLDAFGNKIGTRVNDFKNNLEGDIYKAIGDTSFFDPSTIISGSGALQGYYNPTTKKNPTAANNPLLSAFTEDESQTKSTGLGNTGVF